MAYFIWFLLIWTSVCSCQDFEGNLRALGPDQEELFLPLKETKVNLELTGPILTAEVSQIFYNDTQFNLEAIYNFPLPVGATVTGMVMEYDDVIVRSVVKEKQEAIQVYEEAKTEGKKASLLSQVNSNIFRTSLANFEPGERVEITFSFIQSLDFKGDHYEVVFPTVFGQRFQPELTDAENIEIQPTAIESETTPSNFIDENDEHLVQFNLFIRGLPVASIDSSTHDIQFVECTPDEFQVNLLDTYDLPNRDFSCRVMLDQLKVPDIRLIQSQTNENSDLGVHGLLSIMPPMSPESNLKPVPRDIIFLIDTSGSMEGDGLTQAKQGLLKCLGMIHPQDRFNVVRFSSDVSAFRNEYANYTEKNLKDVGQYIHDLHADGGTEMQKALRYVLKIPKTENHMKVVVFLTDGDVGREDSLISLVKAELNGARIFSFGVGSAPNAYLLKKLSDISFGVTSFIRSESDIESIMSSFFQTVNNPVLTDISINWENITSDQIEIFPTVIPDVYQNRPLQILFRSNQFLSGLLEIHGNFNGEYVTFEYELTEKNQVQSSGMKHLFGQAWVDELMFDFTAEGKSEAREVIRLNIVDVALSYQLVTPFTSRVAISEKKVENPPGELLTVPIPNLYKSQSPYAATATTDPAWLLLGSMLLALGIFSLNKANRRSP